MTQIWMREVQLGLRSRIKSLYVQALLRGFGIMGPRCPCAKIEAVALVALRNEDVYQEAVATSLAWVSVGATGYKEGATDPTSTNPAGGRGQRRHGSLSSGSSGCGDADGSGAYMSFHSSIRNVAMPMSCIVSQQLCSTLSEDNKPRTHVSADL